MNISIASGKGGTGKTTISTNLAYYLAGRNVSVRYHDCDVEEPNGHLFLKPEITKKHPAFISVPLIDENRCTGCGKCVQLCEYNALARLGKTVMVFAELCHGCGGCTLICPQNAITEHEKEIGFVETGNSGKIGFVHGRLNIGEAMSPPLIRSVLGKMDNNFVNIIDAPPGTSCPVIASVKNTDFIVLITEPTPFGLNDLNLAIEMTREIGIPCGVLINRADEKSDTAREFCKQKNVSILAEIPDDRSIAEAYSKGEMIIDAVPQLQSVFAQLWEAIQKQVKK
ncbi:MAG TPA: ATP-binding protein [Chitinispirillaceae bacterium]|nr:ATP-binding protein [Chitinispirillaceae bacterium]